MSEKRFKRNQRRLRLATIVNPALGGSGGGGFIIQDLIAKNKGISNNAILNFLDANFPNLSVQEIIDFKNPKPKTKPAGDTGDTKNAVATFGPNGFSAELNFDKLNKILPRITLDEQTSIFGKLPKLSDRAKNRGGDVITQSRFNQLGSKFEVDKAILQFESLADARAKVSPAFTNQREAQKIKFSDLPNLQRDLATLSDNVNTGLDVTTQLDAASLLRDSNKAGEKIKKRRFKTIGQARGLLDNVAPIRERTLLGN